jgi:hypothetical protein
VPSDRFHLFTDESGTSDAVIRGRISMLDFLQKFGGVDLRGED